MKTGTVLAWREARRTRDDQARATLLNRLRTEHIDLPLYNDATNALAKIDPKPPLELP